MNPTDLQRAVVGCTPSRAVKVAAPITVAMDTYDIVTPTRQAAFLAQIGHESGSLVYTKEMWGPTPAQERYEGRRDLGNIEKGDGFKFRGRGYIQITGRANYRAASLAMYGSGNVLLDDPSLLGMPDAAALSAAWFWHSHGLNVLADAATEEAFLRLSVAINGRNKSGEPNGWNDRLNRWKVAKDALNAQT